MEIRTKESWKNYRVVLRPPLNTWGGNQLL